MIKAYAPAGLEILGNHTDYNDGLALVGALQFGVTLEGEARPDQTVVLHDTASGKTDTFLLQETKKNAENFWANPVKGVILQLLQHQIPLSGFEAVIRHNLPSFLDPNSGGMLSAATVVFLKQICLFEADPGPLAKLCQEAEINIGNTYAGLLGPFASLTATKNGLAMLDFRSLKTTAVFFPQTHKFVVCDSGVKNMLVNAKMKIRRDQCGDALRAIRNSVPGIHALRDVNPVEMQRLSGEMNSYVFRTVMHIATENQRVREATEALSRGDIAALGANMNLSHLSSRQSIENSTAQLDQLIDIAKTLPGFVGSRLTGYGFGGATVHLVTAEQAADFAAHLPALYAQQSGKNVEAFVVELSEGALS